MKILFVTHRYPPRTGGVETHVREIATRLVERGHDVTVFSADAGENLPARTSDKGIQVRRFRSVSPDESFYFAPQMAVAVRRTSVDVVHAHNYHAFPLFFAAVGVTDKRFVVTTHYHGRSANGIRDTLLLGYHSFGCWAVQRADEVIAVSEWEQGQLNADLGVEATVVPNGVDVNRFAAADPVPWDRPYLLSVGRLEQYKGVQHLVTALPELPAYDLLIAGCGSYRGELEELARKQGVADRVVFLGYVNDKRLPRLYAGAAAYVTLSKFEAYGMTVAESLCAGTPVVVRDSGALTDWLDKAGVVGAESIAPDRIASAIKAATAETDVTTVVASWDAVTDRMLAIYRRVDPK